MSVELFLVTVLVAGLLIWVGAWRVRLARRPVCRVCHRPMAVTAWNDDREIAWACERCSTVGPAAAPRPPGLRLVAPLPAFDDDCNEGLPVVLTNRHQRRNEELSEGELPVVRSLVVHRPGGVSRIVAASEWAVGSRAPCRMGHDDTEECDACRGTVIEQEQRR